MAKKQANSSSHKSINDARQRGLASLSGAALRSQANARQNQRQVDYSDVPF